MPRSAKEMLEQLRQEQTPARQRLAELRAQEMEGVDTTPFEIPSHQGIPSPSTGRGAGRVKPDFGEEIMSAARSGVDIATGAPAGRFLAGFSQNQALQAQELEKALAEHFGQPIRMRVDRKSTRLNSSHSQISYAVFCLK